MQVKLPEFLAAGLPTVATAIGARAGVYEKLVAARNSWHKIAPTL